MRNMWKIACESY